MTTYCSWSNSEIWWECLLCEVQALDKILTSVVARLVSPSPSPCVFTYLNLNHFSDAVPELQLCPNVDKLSPLLLSYNYKIGTL